MVSRTDGRPPRDAHVALHSEQGAVRGDRPDRSHNPVVKVHDLAWLEFEKPDLEAAERFAIDFGFSVLARTDEELHLRGRRAGSQCVVIRKGSRSRFIGLALRAADREDLGRLAAATDSKVVRRRGLGDGYVVALTDPSGLPVHVVADIEEYSALPAQDIQPLNVGETMNRVNCPRRPPRAPATVERLGHVVSQTPRFHAALNWYLDNLGMIVSDFQYLRGQRSRGPAMAFIRCDRGETPTDHHTVAMHLGTTTGYVHSAYQVADLDTLAAGGEYLRDNGYERGWGIGRHRQGSQLFDYWFDRDRITMEHFTDGDSFDASRPAGWSEFTASGLSQWGPPVSREFLGAKPSLGKIREIVTALRSENEIDVRRMVGLLRMVDQ